MDPKPENHPAKRRPISARRRFAFLLVLIGFFLGAQELVLRIVFPVPEVANFNRVRYSQTWFKDGDTPAGNLSNTAYVFGSSLDGTNFVHSLNLYGFRDRDWPLRKPDGSTRVAILGDSFVEGAMAPDGLTIPDGFRQAAETAGEKLDVMNLGIQATGPFEYMLIAGDVVPLFKPDYFLIVFYENDFYDLPSDAPWPIGRRVEVPRFNSPYTPRIVHLMRNVAERMPNPTRWRGRPFNFFGAAPDERNPMSHPDFLAEVRQYVDQDILEAMSAGTFNPYITDLYTIEEKSLRQPINISSYLLAFQDWLRQHDIQLLTAYIPINHQVSDAYLPHHARFSRNKHPHSLRGAEYQAHPKSIATICDILEIPFLDLSPKIELLESAGHRLYWNYDNHMKGEAYHLIGEVLHEWFAVQIAKTPDAG
jgi:hypothetical protein